jgi:hypothetical protein
MAKKKEPTKFIAMWDNTGLECLINVTKHEAEVESYEKKKMWNVLKDLKLIELKPKLPLQQMIMRARANSQRHYEIYGFTSHESQKWVEETFANSPQLIVNWIRENGVQIYSDKVETKDVVIV